MALTTAQRNRLPRSAYAYAPAGAPRSQWKYPVPTASQARKAGISEGQRQRVLRNAAARGAQRHTAGSYGRVAPVAKRRSKKAGPMTGLTRGGARRPRTAAGWGRKRPRERRSTAGRHRSR